MSEDLNTAISNKLKNDEAQINNLANQVVELNEGKKEDLQGHSSKWFNLYIAISTKCVEWINNNKMFISLVKRDTSLDCDYNGETEGFKFPYTVELFDTVRKCLENFDESKLGDANFIGYLSKAVSNMIRNLQAKKQKEENENFKLDVEINEDGDTYCSLLMDDKTVEAEKSLVNEAEALINRDNIFTILKLIELWYKKTKAGQENKQQVCTYLALSTLLSFSDKDLELCFERFSFINKKVVSYYKEKSITEMPSRQDYCALTSLDETKLSKFKTQLNDFLISTSNDAIKDFCKLYRIK